MLGIQQRCSKWAVTIDLSAIAHFESLRQLWNKTCCSANDSKEIQLKCGQDSTRQWVGGQSETESFNTCNGRRCHEEVESIVAPQNYVLKRF